MKDPKRRQAFTLVELLVVIFIIGILIALLIPAICQIREPARRNSCATLMKNMALALQKYHDTNKYFPAAAQLEKNKATAPNPYLQLPSTSAPGVSAEPDRTRYSFLYHLLPHLEQKELYDAFDETLPAYDGVGTPAAVPPYSDSVGNAALAQRSMAWLRCPSYRGADYATDKNGKLADGAGAITNYKALGAATPTYLRNMSDAEGAIQYGQHNHFGKISAGSSNTIFFCETREQRYAQWLDGTSATIFGLESGCAVTAPLGTGCKTALNNNNGQDFMPLGTVIGFDGLAGVTWNPTNGQDVPGPMKWGPSSEHTGVVMHALGDASVRQIENQIDPKVYAKLITRDCPETDGQWISVD